MDKLILNLLRNGIFLSVENNTLKVKYNGNSVSDHLLQEIRRNKVELLEYLGREEAMTNYQEIISVNSPGPFRLSSAQRRLWILSQFEEGAAAYNMPGSTYLHQDIDIECFKRSIDSTIERHEILRTVFKEDANGEIRQWVLNKEDLGFTIDYKDFRKEKNKEERVKNYIAEDSYKAFDLEKGPLLRASLLQVEDERYAFYFNMHHIISDGWSLEILSKDILAYYEAYKENKAPALNPLRIQYKDYSTWQLAQLEEESFKAHRNYWLNSLGGELPLLDLPGTKQRPGVKTSNGCGLSTYIGSEATAKLKKYSQEKGGSLFMGLLAAWNVLLYRYTSQKDIIIGTPVAGREHADLEDQIGFYVNTLALRNDLKADESFDALFLRVKQNTLNAYSHQMYPFDRLVEELDLVRDTSRSPVFDVMLTLQNNGENTEGIELSGEELNRIVDLGNSASKFDIELSFQETGNYLSCHVVYNPDVYEREMVEGLLNHYRHLLEALLASPGEKIARIDYLSAQEKHELLFTFNDTEVAYAKDKTVVDLFEEQVLKTPDKIAVVFEDRELSYKELDELSNQLARYLQKKYTIQPDDLVGIKQQRSDWMIISVLGVLKSGGAYVPIDPEYPQERIDYIEQDTKCKVCIDAEELKKFTSIQKEYSKEKVVSTIQPGNLAYVIYTSGSTGKPKGVMIEHSSLVSFMLSFDSEFGLGMAQKIAGSTNLTFDISALEIFGTLCNGKELIVLSTEELNDPHKFLEKIEKLKVEVLQLTPSRLSQIYSITPDLPKSISSVLIGGEMLSEFLYSCLKKGSFESINVYGPTETTIWSTCLKIRNSEKISIGRPLLNERIYLLSEEEELQPVGVTGEICIGGAGLARGYLNNEKLTKEKFIVNPFKPGERLYKTGDLGRWLPGGTIEFIGRKDDQVKIRGYRIELGEIEHALLKNDAIEEAVVIAKETQNKEKELVAYITSRTEQNTSELRAYLKESLPAYMLPSYFVQLEALPLTSSGKINRRALPDPQGLGLLSGVEYVAPGNEIEEKLVKIWEDVLKKEKIGVKDDFFALGGHSLKAMKLLTEYNRSFNIRLSIQDLFLKTQLYSHAELIDVQIWIRVDSNREKNITKENMETFNF